MTKKEIQEALKAATERAATLNALEERTEDQDAELDALILEAEGHSAKLDAIRDKERADQERQAKIGGLSSKIGQPTDRISRPSDPVITRQRESLQDDPKIGFSSLGEFALAVHSAGPHENYSVDRRLAIAAAAGTGGEYGQASVGGALVPPAYSREIWDGLGVQSESLMSMCDDSVVVPEGTDSMTYPATNETSRANGSRAGGMQGYWKAELTQMQESRPTFREVKFEPHELYVFCYVSDKLLRNAPALGRWLPGKARDEINFKVGDAIINGTGGGMPLGWLASACRITQDKESGQAAATVVAKNINKMFNRMHPAALAGAAWFVNPDVMPQLEDMTMTIGTGGVPVYLPPGGLSDAPLGRLKGKPVYPIEYCSALGTEGDIIFANPKFYAVATRSAVRSDMSIHLKFDFNQTAFRFLFEADGQPWIQSAITPFKGSTTRGPLVTLQTRS